MIEAVKRHLTVGQGLGREAVAVGAIVMSIALILDPSAPGRGSITPHLFWIAVLVLATQYGIRGMIASLSASIIALSIAALAVGEGLGWIGSLSSGGELVAFSGAITVAWIAEGHGRRKAQLAAASRSSAARADEAQASFDKLCTVADGLVQRLDRAEISISYLRSLAEGLQSEDPYVVADAAIELAVARVGGRAGAVLLYDGARLRLYAHRGVWSSASAVPPNVFQDKCADRAFQQRRPVTSLELDAIHELDADLAAPIPGRDGKPCGVLVIRGLDTNLELAGAEQHDGLLAEVSAVARWGSRTLAEVVLPRPSATNILKPTRAASNAA